MADRTAAAGTWCSATVLTPQGYAGVKVHSWQFGGRPS